MTDKIMTIVMLRDVAYNGLVLEAGQEVEAPMHLLDVVHDLVERGHARPADPMTFQILRRATAALLAGVH